MKLVNSSCAAVPPGNVVRQHQTSASSTTMRGQVVAILLDGAPQTWSSREEMHLRFSRALVAHGVQPVFVFSANPSEDVLKRLEYSGAQVGPPTNYEGGKWNFCRRFGHIIGYHSVTAVHIAFFNYYSLIPWMARLHGVRHIILHERNSGTLRATSWKKKLLRLRTWIATLPITRVIAVSEYIRQQLVECGVPQSKIVVVHNAIALRRFSPDRGARARLVVNFSIQPEEVILGTVSYFRPFEHFQVIVEALAKLQSRGIFSRLLVAGDGEMRRDMQTLSHKLEVSDRIHWLGHGTDPTPLLQGCDVYITASMGEAFGLRLVEAMACGAPVVATRSGAFPEIVEHGTSGLLVPPLDASALADAIETLAKDKKVRSNLAFKGMERVERHFNIVAATDKLVHVYEAIWGG